ncbi:MAG: response regulator [Armatimonadota bacterium]|nr:response regulator [Armatimonadota bacterium]
MARVLVVDDSGLSRRMLRRMLEEAGHVVSEAEDGASAIERYALETPDAVLLDLTMPDLDGLEVLANLRQLDPEAVVVIATADIQDITRAQALEGGAAGYLTKPLRREEVLAVLSGALEKRRAPR